jgi:hypothetical protein
MSQTLTDRLKMIKNTPGSGENVLIAEINAALDKADNDFRPACKIWSSVDQSIPNNVSTALLYNTTLTDSYAARSEGPMADLANDRIVIRKAGLYLCGCSILANAGTAAGIMRLNMAINGTVNKSIFDPAPAAAKSQEICEPYVLAASDNISASVQQSQGSSRVYTNNTYQNIFALWAIWLGSVTEV